MIGLSRPGFRADYAKGQLEWISKIYKVNVDFLEKFTNNPEISLEETYTTLGGARNKIAQELGQGNLDKYGVLRKRDKPARELLLEDDVTSIMSKEKTNFLVNNLYAELQHIPIKPDFNTKSIFHKEDPDHRGIDSAANLSDKELVEAGLLFYAQRLPDTEKFKNQRLKKFATPQDPEGLTIPQVLQTCNYGGVKRTFISQEDIADLPKKERALLANGKTIPLSNVFIFGNKDTDFKTGFTIYGSMSFTESSKESPDSTLIAICEAYMRKASEEKDPEKCKIYLAKLLYILATTIPVKRGNAAVCEVLTNTIATKAGHFFSLQLHPDDMNWDIQALFSSHSMDDFVEWFTKHCKTLDPDTTKIVRNLQRCEADLTKLAMDSGINKERSLELQKQLSQTQSCVALIRTVSDKNKPGDYKEDTLKFLNEILSKYDPSLPISKTPHDVLFGYLAEALSLDKDSTSVKDLTTKLKATLSKKEKVLTTSYRQAVASGGVGVKEPAAAPAQQGTENDPNKKKKRL